MKQYESNPIASDSDDENKLQKAENRAIKRRKAKFTKSSGRGKPFPSTAHPPVGTITQPGQRSSGATFPGTRRLQEFSNFTRTRKPRDLRRLLCLWRIFTLPA